MLGQISDMIEKPHFPKHYISINPVNIFLFQQAGITYLTKCPRITSLHPKLDKQKETIVSASLQKKKGCLNLRQHLLFT